MTVVEVYQDDGHWPEFGTVAVRDADDGEDHAGPLERWEAKGLPCGTIARAGHSWLEGAAGDGPLVVRLEAHDSEPPAESDDWDEVVETPFLSRSGTVELTFVTGGMSEEHLRLGPAGDYRVRVVTKALPLAAEAGWALRFWPVEAPTPPRWLRRRDPVVPPGNPGWQNLANSPAATLLSVVSMARDEHGRTSLESLERCGEAHFGGPGWLGKPLPRKPNSDLDPAAPARRLGLPEPGTAHAVLDVLVAAGVLDEDDGGYRTHLPAPRTLDVLDLPEPRRTSLERRFEHDRYTSFASDLLMVTLWGGSKQTLTTLAERALASESDVHDTLDWALRTGLLAIEGVLTADFTLTVPDQPGDPERSPGW